MALTPTTGTVFVKVTKTDGGSGVGYRIEVEPWNVKPADTFLFGRIDWVFLGDGVQFEEASLDFKTKDHFADAKDVSGSGPSQHFVLGGNVAPPASAKVVGSDVKTPDNKNDDYTYIVNFRLVGGPKIEIDPGYRVRP